MIVVSQITPEDDLDVIVTAINSALWDEANEMTDYDADCLRAYLQRQDTVFVVCHEVDDAEQTFLGMASGRLEMKPYDRELWLYVDEVDVCADQRQKGAGKKIMQFLIDYASEKDCEEVWLGTEIDNAPANALYKSLDPEEVEEFVGYTFDP